MKFKEKIGNTFVFDGGYAGKELALEHDPDPNIGWFYCGWIAITPALEIATLRGSQPYQDIQTAVNLMQILIKEGLV